MADSRSLFASVAGRDCLGFWSGSTLKSRAVVDFLDFRKSDVATAAGVAVSSVRFDHKMPKEVSDRLGDIANLCALVAEFFGGDVAKTALWFRTRNPLLAGMAPRDMIRLGRLEKLRKFVMNALSDAEREADRAVPARATVATVAPVSSSESLPPPVAAHRSEIAELCRRYRVRRLAVFGSVLRSDFDPDRSDIDVVVDFGPPALESAARQYFDFKSALERLFDRPVDLVELQAMPDTRLKRLIERTQVPVYAEAA